MKFSRSVEKPVWESGTTNSLKGDRGIQGVNDVYWVKQDEAYDKIQALKNDPQRPFPTLFDIVAIDESERQNRPAGQDHRYTLQYLLWNPDRGSDKVLVKVPLEGNDPKIKSITPLFKNADWYEREVYDMMGVTFEGHHNMRRILMPDWWQGHPLRKDHPNRATEMPPLTISEEDLAEYDGWEMLSSGDSYIRRKDEDGNELMILNLGPNHPGTHGVLRIMLTLNGEYMEDVYPVIGYHHRGAEKMAERQTFHSYIPYCDRIDYLGGTTNELPYVLACEQLAGIKVPERATVMRVMLAEIYRLCNHLVWFGTFGHDVGAMTPVFYTFRERENLFKIIEMITGGRMHPNFLRIGGCSMDLPVGWQEPIKLFLKDFDAHVHEYDNLLVQNPIFKTRTRDVGKMSLADCYEWGVTGPNLRASGSKFDLRKVAPYCGYEGYEFEVVSHTDGDCCARATVRLGEMIQSARIIRQCIDLMPEGEVMSRDNRYAFPPRKAETMMDIETLINHFLAVGWGLDMPVGESFVMIEQPKGNSGYYVVSDGRTSPYRLRIRTPSFAHMQTLPALSRGHLLSDLLAVIGAMDFVLADIDR
ncbi:MAG: NADH dehydrogenase (quinone) subunit D [Candidatus Sumerlaeaceae bacterium]|nr:NADH dehydrogenase (quinone) subunit D [Candidatus Sumerlaeaceae bacterium]